MQAPLASVVVDSYNYGRFLAQAIDSALAQTYPRTEVIVVDDGSTDESTDVIAEYGDRIIPLLKENGGQASAFNAGFARSRGDVVVFLDSDDALLPSAVGEAVGALADPETAKVHWPLIVIDENGHRTGEMVETELLDGDFRELVLREGPMTEATLKSAPTSGNAFARQFLERILPMPERLYWTMPDDYLYGLAPAFGRIRALGEPQGLYRLHGDNWYGRLSFEAKLSHGVRDHEQQSRVLRERCAELGIEPDLSTWRARAWWPRIERSVREIEALVPPGDTFVFIDQGEWEAEELVRGRRRLPFPGRNGVYWGLPENDAAAIAELERLRHEGAGFLVFAWSAFWWLEEYQAFGEHVRSTCRCVLENDRLLVFALRVGGET